MDQEQCANEATDWEIAAALGERLPAPTLSSVVLVSLVNEGVRTTDIRLVLFSGVFRSRDEGIETLARWCLVRLGTNGLGPWTQTGGWARAESDGDQSGMKTLRTAWIATRSPQYVVDTYCLMHGSLLEVVDEFVQHVSSWLGGKE